MTFTLRPYLRKGVHRPDRWMATFAFVLPNGRVFPQRRNGPESRKLIRAKSEKDAKLEAKQYDAFLYARLVAPAGSEAVGGSQSERKGPTFAEHVKEWIANSIRNDPSIKPSSADAMESVLRIHVVPFIGALYPFEISDKVMDELRARWTLGGYEYAGAFGRVKKAKATRSQKTINNRLTVINAALKCAVRWKTIPSMPCTIEVPAVESDEAPYYENGDYERLVETSAELDPRIRAVVLLGGDAGLRRNEIAALNLEDVDFHAARVTVRRSVYWKKGVCTETVPKGGKVKTIPCTPRLLAALRACRHLRGPRVLYADDGSPVTPKILKRWIQCAESAAGLPPTGRLHVLRHTFASHLAAAGVPARTVMELCRHASLAVTLKYMHLSPNATREGINMLAKSREQGGKPITLDDVEER